MSQTKDKTIAASVNSYWNTQACIDGYDKGHAEGIGEERDDELWLEEFKERFAPPPAKVLDIGAGTGFVSVLLAELGYEVTGVDQSDKMLEVAVAKAAERGVEIDFIKGSAMEPVAAVSSFDAAVARWVFWTLPNPLAAAQAAFKALKPGGQFVVYDGLWFRSEDKKESQPHSEPGERSEIWDSAYTDEVRTDLPLMFDGSPEAVGEMLSQAGFVDVKTAWMEKIAEEYDRARPREHPQKLYYATGVKPA